MSIFRRESAFPRDPRQQAGESVADLFHENTKLSRALIGGASGTDDFSAGELEAMSRAYKRYRLHPQVPLPPVAPDMGAADRGSVVEVMTARRTTRNFAAGPIDLAELSAILRWSYGITGETRLAGGTAQQLRAAPSAGALYPAEIYVGVREVRGLDPGLYHYEVPEASLARLRTGSPADRLHAICCGQEYARQAAAVLVISAVLERTRRKYGDRGYRFVLLDIGHLGQNLYLACTALGLAMVPTCGFFDDEAADFLGIDGVDEAVFYFAFIGRAPTSE